MKGNTFGQVVKAFRKNAGLSIDVAAKRLRTHKGYVSGIENGKVNPPSPKMVARFFRVYRDQFPAFVTLEDLVELAEVDKAPLLIRDRMRERIATNPLFAATISPTRVEVRCADAVLV